MKENVRFELERSLTKIRNICKRSAEIQKKVKNLERELENLDSALEKEERFILNYGKSSERPRADMLGWTSERTRKAQEYNSKLLEEKREMLNSELRDYQPKTKELRSIVEDMPTINVDDLY